MKLTKYNQLKHGMRVQCKIEENEIRDAKISIDSGGEIFICQNIMGGVRAEDMLGYRYSWTIHSPSEGKMIQSCFVEDLRTREIDFDTMEAGDMVKTESGNYFVILDVHGMVVDAGAYCGTIESAKKARHDLTCSIEEFKSFFTENGWSFVQEKDDDEDTIEFTLEEIAEAMNIPVEKLRIKE